MIAVGIGYGLVALVAIVLASLYARKILPLLIPALFGILFLMTLHMPDFYGYAVDDNLVFGKEATLLESTESEKWIYMLVQFTSEIQPRLIRIESTEENRKEREAAQEQADSGLAVIRFGENGGNPTNGSNGSSSGGSGVGGQGEQGGGEAGSFQLLDFGETESFAKQ